MGGRGEEVRDHPPLESGSRSALPRTLSHVGKAAPSVNGSLIYCRYFDHVFFKDVDSSRGYPVIRECVGWLDYENHEFIRIIFEKFSMPFVPEGSRQRDTGLAILKSTIIELRKINTPSLKSALGGRIK